MNDNSNSQSASMKQTPNNDLLLEERLTKSMVSLIEIINEFNETKKAKDVFYFTLANKELLRNVVTKVTGLNKSICSLTQDSSTQGSSTQNNNIDRMLEKYLCKSESSDNEFYKKDRINFKLRQVNESNFYQIYYKFLFNIRRNV